jgi:hypothetical protein
MADHVMHRMGKPGPNHPNGMGKGIMPKPLPGNGMSDVARATPSGPGKGQIVSAAAHARNAARQATRVTLKGKPAAQQQMVTRSQKVSKNAATKLAKGK